MQKSKINMAKFVDYIKFFMMLIIIYICLWGWKNYTIILIPLENNQMLPNIKAKEFYIGSRYSSKTQIRHGDVIYYDYPHKITENEKGDVFIARIIGMAGDLIMIKQGKVYKNNEELEEPYIDRENFENKNYSAIVVPRGHVYILVDNRKLSLRRIGYRDSRTFGPVPIQIIQGKIKGK